MAPDVFNGLLLPGERIAWEGRPGQGLVFTSRDIFLIPFSLIWCGFAVFWEVTVFRSQKAPAFFLLWGAMFVCIGLFSVVGRFFADAWVRSAMYYAVTNRRILILRQRPFKKFAAIGLNQLPSLDLSERSRGRGTIRFAPAAALWGRRQNMGMWAPALDATPQFIMIDDVRSVFDLIQKSQA